MIITPCGHTCDQCPSYLGQSEKQCPGCLEAKGTPWWGICEVFNCANDKNLQHCGLCTDFPCEMFVSHYDPDNPEGQKNAVIRTGILSYRSKHGDDKTIELVRKLRSL